MQGPREKRDANGRLVRELHGGESGLALVQGLAADFLAAGGVRAAAWMPRAVAVHQRLCAQRLSPGGSADLLAACIFVDLLERGR